MDPPQIRIHGADGEETDSYTAAIELANTCREYYVSRLKIVQERKEKLLTPHKANIVNTQLTCDSRESGGGSKDNLIDELVEKLKQEMASLMDQDLDLMKQLLMLNDQIEELKWRKRYSDKTPLVSSTDLNSSEYAMADYDTDSHTPVQSAIYLPNKYPSPSSLSLCQEETPSTSRDLLDDKVDDNVRVTFQALPVIKRLHSSGGSEQSGHTSVTRQGSYHSAQEDSLYGQAAYSGAVPPHVALSVINNSSDDDSLKRLDHSEQQSFDSGFNEGDQEHTELAMAQKRIASIHEQHRQFISGSHKVTTL